MAKKAIEKRKYTTITIPTRLFERLQEKIKQTSFSSVSDYITYILREMLVESEMKKKDSKDKEGVVERLRALGYI